MIPFQGRTKHLIKIKGKPIKEGFKMWCLGFKGYIWSFNFHLGQENDEGIIEQQLKSTLFHIKLAPTFQVEKMRHIYSKQLFLVFLDNLFLNIPIAHCLLAIGFAIMGTTRKNAPSQITHFSQR